MKPLNTRGITLTMTVSGKSYTSQQLLVNIISVADLRIAFTDFQSRL